MDAAQYLRKSRMEEGLETDEVLAKHRKALADYAARNDIRIIATYEEVVSGESLYARPEMLRLLRDVEAGSYDAVLCMDLDRLSRGRMHDQGIILDAFREEASEKTWLTRIAINCCKNVYRSGWFRHVDRNVTLDMITERPAPADPADDCLTTEIMNLPIRLREAALLCWLQGMTCEEAAQALGISRQAVGSRLNRARKKLRFALEGREDP